MSPRVRANERLSVASTCAAYAAHPPPTPWGSPPQPLTAPASTPQPPEHRISRHRSGRRAHHPTFGASSPGQRQSSEAEEASPQKRRAKSPKALRLSEAKRPPAQNSPRGSRVSGESTMRARSWAGARP